MLQERVLCSFSYMFTYLACCTFDAAGESPVQLSPLLAVTEDRGYVYVGQGPSEEERQQQREEQRRQLLKGVTEPGQSAFEAAFGQPAVSRPRAEGGEDMEVRVFCGREAAVNGSFRQQSA
jgi:hypothetical protein